MVFPANMMRLRNVAMRVLNLHSLCCAVVVAVVVFVVLVIVVVAVVDFYFFQKEIIAVVGYPPTCQTAAEWH